MKQRAQRARIQFIPSDYWGLDTRRRSTEKALLPDAISTIPIAMASRWNSGLRAGGPE